jgi:hypothetical protein
MWKEGRHSNDYRYFDRQIGEMFTVGGVGINLHKYLGSGASGVGLTTSAAQSSPGVTLTFADTSTVKPGDFVFGTAVVKGTTIVSKTSTTIRLSQATTTAVASGTTVKFSVSATEPAYINSSAQNIQDLLFLENRDRIYDPNIYSMRGIYTASDNDFELSQFGLFLTTGTTFMVFHINDMIDIVGRKIMSGDVLEFAHLKDFQTLNEELPAALKRYYVVGDTSRASEGFSATWWPHLWRVKLTPLVDSQEYKDILNTIKAGDDTEETLADVLSTYQTYSDINDNIILQAEKDVPYSGYDTNPLYTKSVKTDGYPEDPDYVTADQTNINVASSLWTADQVVQSPDKSIQGYLTGDGIPPNGLKVTSGVTFPTSPKFGQYFLRSDFRPNRLFRWNGKRWDKIEDVVRTRLTRGPDNLTQHSTFVNNTSTYTNSSGEVYNERQALNEIFKPRSDV